MPIQKITVEEIIKSSIRVFRQKGYYRATMSDLAAATGLTKGVFYHHFKNKEDVMLKALEMTNTRFEAKVFSIVFKEEIPMQERLEQMTSIAFRAFTDDIGGCFFANTILETANVEDTFLHEIKIFFQNWEKAFHYVFEKKYPNKQERTDFVQQIIADIEGSIVLMQLYKDKTYLERAFGRVMKKL